MLYNHKFEKLFNGQLSVVNKKHTVTVKHCTLTGPWASAVAAFVVTLTTPFANRGVIVIARIVNRFIMFLAFLKTKTK